VSIAPLVAPGRGRSFRRRLSVSTLLPFVLLAALIVVDVTLQPALLARDQVGIEAAATMSLVLVALGQTVVILTRGIDLSVGGMMSLSNCLLATHAGSGVSLALWLAIIVGVGALGGLVNGALVALTPLQPFVITLATWSILGGLALWVLDSPGGHVPGALVNFPIGNFLLVPRTLWLLAGLCLVWFYLRRTMPGVRVYALGSDPESSFLSGVSKVRTTLAVYAFSGVCAALAGIFVATQTASGSPKVGDPFILGSVAAVVVGGTSLFGGRGGFGGTVAGAFVLTLIGDVTFQVGISSYWAVLAQGLLLIGAVAVSSTAEILRRRREGSR